MIIPLVSLIPIQKELEYLRDNIDKKDFDFIFKQYPNENKNLTEAFYLELASESNSYSTLT
jgi:hypothetical protein